MYQTIYHSAYRYEFQFQVIGWYRNISFCIMYDKPPYMYKTMSMNLWYFCRRHVLRFMMSGPLGYSVHLVSTVPFVFGNEEEVMPELTKVRSKVKILNCPNSRR